MSATAALLVLTATAAIAHPQSSAAINEQDDWKVAVYPVFAWLPMGIDIDVEVPPGEGGGSGGAGAIVDGRFDGAYLGGFSAAKRFFSGSTLRRSSGRRSVEIARICRF